MSESHMRVPKLTTKDADTDAVRCQHVGVGAGIALDRFEDGEGEVAAMTRSALF